jgi:hypothetical protein
VAEVLSDAFPFFVLLLVVEYRSFRRTRYLERSYAGILIVWDRGPGRRP